MNTILINRTTGKTHSSRGKWTLPNGMVTADNGELMRQPVSVRVEMGEYTYDTYLSQGPIGQITGNTQMQGSPTQDPLDDTMNDLFTDTAGGIVGALLGVFLIRRSEREGGHWKVANEIEHIGN